jgi:type I restriction enzyme S subunit
MSLMRIDDLFHFEKGILQSSKCTEGEFDFITASSEWKTHNEYTHNCEALIFAAAASGSLGRTHYVNGKFISSDLCFIITAKDPKKFPIDLKFYHMIFNEFKNDIVNSTKAGTSKEAIGMKAFGNYKLPYFDIDKQIETKVQFVNMQHSKVELFTELTHQLDLIKQLRQAFLREAMQGKLVKSTNTKETGQQLLKKIKAEKAKLIAEKKLKKEKELPPIAEDEIPFEIPKNWAWCRLGKIVNLVTSGSRDWAKYYSSEGDMFVRMGNLSRESFNLRMNKIQYVKPPQNKEGNRTRLEAGDILVSITGEVGNLGLIPENFGEAYINQHTALVRLNKEIVTKYICYLFLSEIMQRQFNAPQRGMKNSFRLSDIDFLLIPLPPLQEQEQIVTKLKGLMSFCDGLEQSIKESQGYNEMLLQQVLREALQPKVETKVISLQSRKIEKPLQTIIAGHIINLNNTTDFGRVKFQKLLYLTEYICKIDFDSHYIQKVAGPYDEVLIKTIEADFNRLRLFTVIQDKTDYKRVNYNALPSAHELERSFLEYFPDESVIINNTLLKFRPLSWGECELVATLYAVWNNRIIKSEPISDDLLYNDFMAWDKQKIKYKDIFYKWLFWMKDERIIPDGWGKYIEKNIMS